jgi:hypothetical protein
VRLRWRCRFPCGASPGPGFRHKMFFDPAPTPLHSKHFSMPYSRITDSNSHYNFHHLTIFPLIYFLKPKPRPRWHSNILHKVLAIIHMMSDGITSEASQKILAVPGILGNSICLVRNCTQRFSLRPLWPSNLGYFHFLLEYRMTSTNTWLRGTSSASGDGHLNHHISTIISH